jgi:hypothetical protein
VQERGGTLTLPHFRLSNTLRTLNPYFFTLHRRQLNMTIHGRTGLCCPIAGLPVDRRDWCGLRECGFDLRDADPVSANAEKPISRSLEWCL